MGELDLEGVGAKPRPIFFQIGYLRLPPTVFEENRHMHGDPQLRRQRVVGGVVHPPKISRNIRRARREFHGQVGPYTGDAAYVRISMNSAAWERNLVSDAGACAVEVEWK